MLNPTVLFDQMPGVLLPIDQPRATRVRDAGLFGAPNLPSSLSPDNGILHTHGSPQ